MNETVSCPPQPERDTRTINEVVVQRIARLRQEADEMETKLAALPAEVLDTPVETLHGLSIYF